MLPRMTETHGANSPLIVVTVADPSTKADPALAERKNRLYAEALSGRGCDPVLLSAATPAADRERALAGMAGLLLSGGADIDPGEYGEAAAGAAEVEPERDALERAAWDAAGARGVPVLGICRGHQAINVFGGGKLLQDVGDHTGVPYGQGPALMHFLEIEPDSKLGRAIASAAPNGVAGADEEDIALELEVNSFHHQAVGTATLAPGLVATAWADSSAGRIVEGLEAADGRWVVGVQCHPERLESTPEEFAGLWDAFADAARQFAAGGRPGR
jgi:putative glutamine amidotransferase